MPQVSPDSSVPAALKALSLVWLLELHGALDVECSRQQEVDMQAFLASLELDELGARPITEGLLKCHLNQIVKRKQKPRSVSWITFRDPAFEMPDRAGSGGEDAGRRGSQILSQRWMELRAELAQFKRKKPLSQRR
jgi:hypothetical protein